MPEERQSIIPIPLEAEVHKSYMAYAMSVLVARALPDARDGLKPSQRRILVAMNDLRLSPAAKYRKCAKIAGDTSGNYHPHGEQIVYPTLYRMAQWFSLRYPLVDGQGNFGSIDGDPPAAMRYTEARMDAHAMEMLADLERNTVDFEPNYDETLMVPMVLPARFPNLLCNGSTGIAVGMATNIPPHNLNEIVDAAVALIENPDLGADDLMEYVKGPDFPTGAIIYGVEGIREAYRTGRGKIKVRARATIERLTNGRDGIVLTEIPYMLSGTTLKEKIAEVARNKVVEGIHDFRDESDREGMRMVIELKRDAYPEVTLNQLYKHTPMETGYGIIMLALVDGRPKEMPLKEMLEQYIMHRHEVVTRRAEFDLDQAQKRDHILLGLLIALDNLDRIIEIIRGSADSAAAKVALIAAFELSELQTDAILDMRLGRLTALEHGKIEADHNELLIKITELQAILGSKEARMDIVKDELLELQRKYGDERRTEIIYSTGDFSIEDLVAEEDMVVTISHQGYIKRLPATTYRSQHRGGRGVTGMSTKDEDFVEHLFVASTHSNLLCLSTEGHCYRLKVYEIPQAGRAARGRPLVNLLEAARDAKIAAIVPVRDFKNQFLAMVTQKGTIKKTPLEAFERVNRRGVIAVKTSPGDQLVDAKLTDGSFQIILGTSNGQAIRFEESDVRAMGRPARGVRGIRLKGKDVVMSMVIVTDKESTLLTVCENGYGKRSPIEEYRITKRGGMGVINIKATKRNGKVVSLMDVADDSELMIVTEDGVLIRCPISDISTIGRNTQGVRLINVGEGDRVRDVAPMAASEDENNEENGEVAEGTEGQSTDTADSTSEADNGSPE